MDDSCTKRKRWLVKEKSAKNKENNWLETNEVNPSVHKYNLKNKKCIPISKSNLYSKREPSQCILRPMSELFQQIICNIHLNFQTTNARYKEVD